MKTIFFFLIFALLMTACGGKDDADTATPGSDTFMKATVAGKPFSTTGTGSPSDTRGASAVFQQSNSTLYLNGNNGTTFLAVVVDKFPRATGTFLLGDIIAGRGGNFTDNTDSSNPIVYFGKSGTLTVTKFDGKTMEGTFSYTTYNKTLNKEVQVTNGEFKVIYEEI
jgi:hypothetical protein